MQLGESLKLCVADTMKTDYRQTLDLQASGNQVALAGKSIGASFETFIMDDINGNLPSYDCRLLNTNRVYDNDGEDLLGQGFFILEVIVEQRVYVTATDTLTIEQVTSLVGLGFNRGDGGRVKFRSLLQQYEAFESILNVEVLESVSSPQAAPSSIPSAFPSGKLSFAPSPAPTITPSAVPTDQPSHRPSIFPTAMTTNSPSFPPYNVPMSSTPLKAPTLLPAALPTTLAPSSPSSSKSNNDGLPLIIGTTIGGVLTMLVCCFFVFCVWFPYWREGNTGDGNGPNRQFETSSQMSSGRDAIVPGVVQLDDASLANTTLGDETTDGGFRNNSAESKRPQYSFLKPAPIASMDSFDESSLYTSPGPPASNANQSSLRISSIAMAAVKPPVMSKIDTSMELNPSLSLALHFEDDIVFPLSESKTDWSTEKRATVHKDSMHSVLTGGGVVDLDEVYFFDDDESKEEGFERVPGIPGKLAITSSKSDEEKARKVSQSMEEGTRGFDPFDEEKSGSSSSFTFDNGVETAEIFKEDSSSDTEEDESLPVTNPHQSKRVMPLLSGSTPEANDTQRGIQPCDVRRRKLINNIGEGALDTIEHNRNGHDSKGDLKEKQREARLSRSARKNNSLLRNVLEDARRLAEAATSNNRSRASRKTAPPRFVDKIKRNSHDSQPFDLLADTLDVKESLSLASAKRPAHSTKGKVVSKMTAARSKGSGDLTSDNDHARIKAFATTHLFRSHLLGKREAGTGQHSLPSSTTSNSSLRLTVNVEAEITDATSAFDASSVLTSANPRDSPQGKYAGQCPENQSVLSPPNNIEILYPNGKITVQDDLSCTREGAPKPLLTDAVDKAPEACSTTDIKSTSVWSIAQSSQPQRSRNSRCGSISSTGRQLERSPVSTQSRRQNRRLLRDEIGSSSRTFSSAPERSQGEEKSLGDDTLPLAFEQDLERLKLQLVDIVRTDAFKVGPSSITASKNNRSIAFVRKNKKDQIVVIVPPGKVGVVLANRYDGKGTMVSEVRPSSAVHGAIFPGDEIVEVDGEDVTAMVVKDIISLVSSKSKLERRLTLAASKSGKNAIQGLEYIEL
jgi:hypothetical protein